MLKLIVKEMRLKQWTKNAFIFAALVFDRKLLNGDAFIKTFIAFLLFCLLASSVYIINDILDREYDRNHPLKKNRPIASGKLPVSTALIFGLIFLSIALVGAFFLSCGLFIITIVYFLLNMAYSKWLKHFSLSMCWLLQPVSCCVSRLAFQSSKCSGFHPGCM